ncbi:MAG TPA: serine/threonine-protein kinase [Kofleriaceae bacterium]|nr:serine/threonine-protein kinase [Kofleriaceae bacterium]
MRVPSKPDLPGELAATRTARARSDARVEPGPPEFQRGTAFGRYVVLERIGEGGMGVVYAAYDSELDRKVALKFLNPDGEESGVRRDKRLLREAHAMARLSHPNVVVVYEVGRFEGRIFLAMEFVDGMDLRAWLAAGPRTTAEILDVFRGAAQGLAAAHAAGIIHRDFKPANVLVDAKSRARVTDFGLSRASPVPDDRAASEPLRAGDLVERGDGAEGSHGAESGDAADSGEGANTADGAEGAEGSPSPASPLAVPLTWTGDVLGTPSYMAPEQRAGGQADPRSDQFSFCVALHEALHREHPFEGKDAAELLDNIRAGKVRPPHAASSVPRWCRPALLRGLRPDPAERFPSMDALLAELSNRPIRRRRRIAVAVALGLFVAGGAAYGLLVDRDAIAPPPRCDQGARRLAGVWDGARQRETRGAFEATGVPGADRTWNGFASTLGRRAASWVQMSDRACAATHHDGVQSPAVLDLRIECLDRKLEEMRGLVDVYSEKLDKKVLDRALDAAENLSSISGCADVTNLRAVVPLPGDPTIRAKVLDVRHRLGRAEALFNAGQFKEGRPFVAALKREADALGYAPLKAQVATSLGEYLKELGEGKDGEKVLFEAIEQAVKGQDGIAEASAWVSLAANFGRRGQVPEALLAARTAQLAVERANGDRVLHSRMFSSLAYVELIAGQPDKSLDHYQQAMAQWEALHESSTSPRVANTLGNIGLVLNVLGRTRESLPYLERALASRKASLRADHPQMAASMGALGRAYHSIGMFRKARDLFAAALEILRKELGPEHPETVTIQTALAFAEANLGNHAQAIGLVASSLSVQRRILDPRDVELGQTYLAMGEVQKSAARHLEAQQSYERAIEQFERAKAPDHVSAGWALAGLGMVHNAVGRHREALRACRRGLAILKKELPENSDELLGSVICVGEALIGTGDLAAARAELEPALARFSEQDGAPQDFAELRFHLARALWATPADRRRARDLAGAAVSSLRAAEGDRRELIGRVESWLKAHPEPAGR